jgi:hypothetical protein
MRADACASWVSVWRVCRRPQHACTRPRATATPQVGLLETREQAERKSGAEAWSLRVHSSVVEHPFTELVAKHAGEGDEVPFHRIAWFKQNGALVW